MKPVLPSQKKIENFLFSKLRPQEKNFFSSTQSNPMHAPKFQNTKANNWSSSNLLEEIN